MEGDGSDKSAEDCQAFNTLGNKIEALAKSYKLANSCKTFTNCSGKILTENTDYIQINSIPLADIPRRCLNRY